MLSLCMIVKADDKEAKLLERCLRYISPYVDEICLTITGTNKKCEAVAKSFNAKVSHFKWVNDFSKARNYNFKQASGDYILWLDCDDVVKGAHLIPDTVKKMEEGKADAVVMHYLYDFDQYGNCIVKHLKTRIVKNDGCVKWVGELHEDFDSTREINQYLEDRIQILHLTDERRAGQSAKRNLEIAFQALEAKPDDPRSLYLVANAYMAENKHELAEEYWLQFIEKSGSEEEKYIALLNLNEIFKEKDIQKAKLYTAQAWMLRPSYPNAYHKLGELSWKEKKYDTARNFIELGLQMPIPDTQIIVHNPREYDYVPLLMLLNIHFETGEYQKAVKTLDTLIQWYPQDENLQNKKKILDKEIGDLNQVDDLLKEAEKIEDKDKLKTFLDNLPEKIQMHPKVWYFRNINFIKEEASGKDISFYCGFTTKSWSPKSVEKGGVGGSEESVINIAKYLATKGWNVTVYNHCGKDAGTYDGVSYKPFWAYNVRDKQDITIYWRHPKCVDHHENGGKIVIDMHDVIPAGEFNEERTEKIAKIFVKTKAHRILFPEVKDEKFVTIPNGLDVKHFTGHPKRQKYLVLSTSSPDRHLEATLDVFEELIKRQPEKPWKLAWFYGWGVYDDVHAQNKDMINWKKRQMDRFESLMAQGRAEGGYMLSHTEIAKKYQEAGVFLYPTQFYEIHCISGAKAQAGGAIPITSDFAALNETIQYGLKIHTDGRKWMKAETYGDTDNTEAYVLALLAYGAGDGQMETRETESRWALETYDWQKIGEEWHQTLSNL